MRIYPLQRVTALFLAILVSLVIGCSSTTATQQPLAADEDTLLIVIDDPRSERRRQGLPGPGYSAKFNYDSDPLLKRAANAIANDHQVDILLQWPIKNLGVHCFVIKRPDETTIEQIKADKRVRWTQPFNEFELLSVPTKPASTEQSFMQRFISDVSQRGEDVVIAVVDTGADIDHPDLQASNLAFRDFVGDARPIKAEAHGTAVVGIIAANPQQRPAVAGLAPGAKVHLMRGCWQTESGSGRCNTLTLARALDAALELNPQVLNLSLTGPSDRVLQALIKQITQQGTLVIAAFDEQREQGNRFPNSYPGVVYAYGTTEVPSPSSQPLNEVLYAPRNAISLAPQAGYELVSGHSIATPQLAAMAACFIERHPHKQREQIVLALRDWLSHNH